MNINHPLNALAEIDKKYLLDMPKTVPSTQEMLSLLYDEQEELLLAVVAAGVPVDCIVRTDTDFSYNNDLKNYTLSIGFVFTTNSVYS